MDADIITAFCTLKQPSETDLIAAYVMECLISLPTDLKILVLTVCFTTHSCLLDLQGLW